MIPFYGSSQAFKQPGCYPVLGFGVGFSCLE